MQDGTDRNALFETGFGRTHDQTKPVVIAGFTEITNNGKAEPALKSICGELKKPNDNTSIKSSYFIRSGDSEFTPIYVNDNYVNVKYSGRCILDYKNGGYQIGEFEIFNKKANKLTLGRYPLVDVSNVRALVFIICDIHDSPYKKNQFLVRNIVVGFIHNMFESNIAARSALPTKLPEIAAKIRDHPYQDGTKVEHFIFGGDYNVPPIPRRDRKPTSIPLSPLSKGITKMSPDAIKSSKKQQQILKKKKRNVFGRISAKNPGTTFGGNMFDYWFVPDNTKNSKEFIVDPSASEHTLNYYGHMSDHAMSIISLHKK